MTDPTRAASSAAGPVQLPYAGHFEGRARSFRESQATRRSVRRAHIAEVLVVAILVLGVYVIVAAKPFSPSSGGGFPWSPGPPGAGITVHFGTPSVRNLTCGSGGTAYAERIPWTNSTFPLSTSDVYVQVYEIWDRDNIPDASAVANTTSSDLCAGAAPTSMAGWYVVLEAPNGTNLLTYTETTAWTSVTSGGWNLPIENNSALILVTYASLAGTGRGLEVGGSLDQSPISGSVPL
jgi:hypothetical protein